MPKSERTRANTSRTSANTHTEPTELHSKQYAAGAIQKTHEPELLPGSTCTCWWPSMWLGRWPVSSQKCFTWALSSTSTCQSDKTNLPWNRKFYAMFGCRKFIRIYLKKKFKKKWPRLQNWASENLHPHMDLDIISKYVELSSLILSLIWFLCPLSKAWAGNSH